MAKKTKRAESRARYFTRQTAQAKGWNLAHPQRGGDFLEEQEVADYLHESGLGLSRPDFVLCIGGEPAMVIETKNDLNKHQQAIDEAMEYADIINTSGRYSIKVAVGLAGSDENGFIVSVKFFKDGLWTDLTAKGNALTAIPSKKECSDALAADNSTTNVSIPSMAEFIDAAIEVSNVLRTAKVEPQLRPKVVGAFTTALYVGDVSFDSTSPLKDINKLSKFAITTSEHFGDEKKKHLIEAITLGENEYARLIPFVFRIISILKRLNVRSVLQSDADFLGMFYEAFLRYGADNNAMGIVFTPRHITSLCVDLVGVEIGNKIIDITCGTGGFLVSAFDYLKNECRSDSARELVRESIYGFDTNPTVWALACLNMFFRGDGKSNIENASSLEKESRTDVKNRFHRAFLNPPFHQAGEPERDFIDASMDALIQGGLFAGVIYAGVFADEENAVWRSAFMEKHTILGMISLPDELFYPNASAITTILIARAHIPQPKDSRVFIGRIANDGFEKLKGKRVACAGSQIPEIQTAFQSFMEGHATSSPNHIDIPADWLRNGSEFSPQQYLPHTTPQADELHRLNSDTLLSIFKAITSYPDITENLRKNLESQTHKERLPLNKTDVLSRFFDVKTGKSAGVKTYSQGIMPYVSSGDGTNGIVGLVSSTEAELCDGSITVSAFGTAYLQPWNYMARGNGGSSVRVLIPKYQMTIRELFWFIAQINSQKWRFTYARQAIKARLERLQLTSPPQHLEEELNLTAKISAFKQKLAELSQL